MPSRFLNGQAKATAITTKEADGALSHVGERALFGALVVVEGMVPGDF